LCLRSVWSKLRTVGGVFHASLAGGGHSQHDSGRLIAAWRRRDPFLLSLLVLS
jgi:hypothetical protein